MYMYIWVGFYTEKINLIGFGNTRYLLQVPIFIIHTSGKRMIKILRMKYYID